MEEITSVLFGVQEKRTLKESEEVIKEEIKKQKAESDEEGKSERIVGNYRVVFPNDYRISYSGRIDKEDTYAPLFVYPCSSIRVRFYGSSVKLLIQNHRGCWDNYLGFWLDGKEEKVQLSKQDMECITLGEGLADTEHELLLFKRMDSCHTFHFYGLAFQLEGGLLQPPEKPKRKIEVYGDSVSAGEVSEAVQYCGMPDPPHQGEFSNSYYSYAWMTARKLDAQIHDIAQGGIALLDRTGYFHYPDYRGMEQTYHLLHYNTDLGPDTEWDFNEYIPNVVIVAIGQNDNHPEDYMMEDFFGAKAMNWKQHYHDFIQKLRMIYPKTLIVLTTTILCHHENWDKAIEEVCTELNDEKIKHFLYQRNGYGTRGHIRIPEADEMSDELVSYLNSFGDEIWEE